ncbi:FAD-binding oxidoreductase [Lichenihabitans sp. Uapishka_5]|uniref:NAD(P)/FAD-dependent oxidoreductase n=1 Tax=Lichenihabitans sp. Uapishka_5 TaxID=3037302 RepID=UPI0029E81267|nr:FAD-binding oxidoreductase [Lichenihabitans sp. Uapishka_5]MDX7952355.1 FAD-binding oxidoreductase [Lichenihabitans sp. Uapishka_5]
MSKPFHADHAQTVIVGAGIVGSALALHLARMGQRDILVLDRGSLNAPAGSTGHAPGLLGRNAASASLSAMACETASLLAELPTGTPALTRVGSIEIARDRTRLGEIERKFHVATERGLRARLMTSEEVVERVPYLNPDVIAAGLFLPDDGVLDVKRGLWAIQAEAAALGVAFRENTEVTGFERVGGHVAGVRTADTVLSCDRVVIATGIWGRFLLDTLDVALPIVPVQHPYVTTAPVATLAGSSAEATHPFVRDVERLFYLREHGDRLGFGWFSHLPTATDPQAMTTADMPFPSHGLLDDLEHDLVPLLGQTALEQKLNGLLSMTPDGLPLIGQVDGRPELWVAEALWVTHAGGAGRALAELMLGRAPWIDLEPFRLNRFSHVDVEANRQQSLSLYNNIYAWGG